MWCSCVAERYYYYFICYSVCLCIPSTWVQFYLVYYLHHENTALILILRMFTSYFSTTGLIILIITRYTKWSHLIKLSNRTFVCILCFLQMLHTYHLALIARANFDFEWSLSVFVVREIFHMVKSKAFGLCVAIDMTVILDIIHCLDFSQTQRFGNRICYYLQLDIIHCLVFLDTQCSRNGICYCLQV